MPQLFKPFAMGERALSSRIAVAPLTPARAEPFVANQDLVAQLEHNRPRSVAPRAFHDVLRGLPR
ncbi:MAG: hypothetical protein COC14_09655 [Burkholderiaceae bacterium]|jgi:2,4-dienoyl-CoA reductase-like NADH-dependent reductase (Old Yellow Enzyme family)|uniref:Uncharacterized protein n=1 Tax=Cupriavidus metallidurans TaxID=119219 RepID=A0A482IW54_9BURK|nr:MULTISPECIES: hypothetical protein [Cupriavidus]KWR85725.1 hypothetical protein RN01_05020 [Cupriavidus sp. SHE]PCH55264.1 MAG: hypothetical protein COC14_09655 [Burkholderiaceae bacterium]QBP13315.1 hypothetical protein DDF84_027165 [Cupriavidus metallidurans]QWC91119.1 hypothetical protein KB891_26830 [Cupriavidus metallidurans]